MVDCTGEQQVVRVRCQGVTAPQFFSDFQLRVVGAVGFAGATKTAANASAGCDLPFSAFLSDQLRKDVEECR
jgi:hypothetical protein